ncbi:hypothetical protein N0V90_004792 [Kalmusia sp. IMI 367209]|nr:hypothetical protein N0V90_004792 [Kalmusia sp. IMI 367209]
MSTSKADAKTSPRTYKFFLIARHTDDTTRYILEDNDGDIYWGVQSLPLEFVSQTLESALDMLPRNLLDAAQFFPLLNPTSITIYSGLIDDTVYVKKQDLLHNMDCTTKPRRFKTLLTRELINAERLARHPHPNICAYRGAILHPASHRVMALAYKRYTLDLHEFVVRRHLVSASQIDTVTSALRAGLAHLHNLDIVHCDLRPVNIFLSLGPPAPTLEGGMGLHPVIQEVVIGDFDASVGVGEMITEKIISEKWRSEDFDFGSPAAVDLDLFALRMVEMWLWRLMKPEGPQDAGMQGTFGG